MAREKEDGERESSVYWKIPKWPQWGPGDTQEAGASSRSTTWVVGAFLRPLVASQIKEGTART